MGCSIPRLPVPSVGRLVASVILAGVFLASCDAGGTGSFRGVVALSRKTGRGVVVLVSTAFSSASVTEAGLLLLTAPRTE